MSERSPGRAWRDPFEFLESSTADAFDREVARRTVRISTFLAAGAAVTFALIFAISGPGAFIAPNLLAAVLLLLVGFAPFPSWRVQLYLAVTIGLALLATQVLMLGRVDTGSTVWFLVPPLAAMLIGARGVAAYTAAVAIGVVVVVVLAGQLGWPILGDVVLPRPDIVMALSVSGVILTSGAVANVALQARQRLMVDVEARTAELTRALEEAHVARAQAVAAAEAKDRFFANLTHEIRTPLSGIAGSAELLADADLPPEQHEIAVALASSGRNLAALVNAMLNHARLRAGNATVEIAPLEVGRLAAELDHLFRPTATAKGLSLAVTVADDLPAWVDTDGVKVRQVVTNLLGNALKFTDHGWVTAAFDRGTDGGDGSTIRLRVTVTDTGPGIPPELVGEVFEPFVQADPSISRTHGGTGLGLAIGRQIADLLDGTLTVRSRIGEGSTFTFSIPVLPAQPPAPVPVPVETSSATRAPRVLLVEDNDLNRTVSARMLERLGAVVSTAEDGSTALTMATTEPFDVVLMDLQMPGVDGISAARELRRWEAANDVEPVRLLALTGNAPEDYAEACTAAGMDGFLVKPVNAEQLRSVLEGGARA